MGLSVLCMSITLDYIQLVPQSSVFRPLDSRLRTPDSPLPLVSPALQPYRTN